MRFDDFRNSLEVGPRADLDQGWERCGLIFRDNATHRQFVLNFEAECRLPPESWEALGPVIVGGPTNPEDLQGAFATVFRMYTLRGDAIPSGTPAPLGRAVTREVFMELLREQFGFSSDYEAEQLLDDLLDPRATTDSVRQTLEDKYLGRADRLMWATFDADGAGPTGQNPFFSMPADADSIRARLGLSPNDEGKDLLLFVYELPALAVARYPTIADAYAGWAWLLHFRPSREGDPWGMTMPWEAGLAPYPEVVHEPFKAACVSDRIRMARG